MDTKAPKRNKSHRRPRPNPHHLKIQPLYGDERRCRICKCTQYNPCPEGCYWVEEDLCSSCR